MLRTELWSVTLPVVTAEKQERNRSVDAEVERSLGSNLSDSLPGVRERQLHPQEPMVEPLPRDLDHALDHVPHLNADGWMDHENLLRPMRGALGLGGQRHRVGGGFRLGSIEIRVKPGMMEGENSRPTIGLRSPGMGVVARARGEEPRGQEPRPRSS